MNIQKMYLKHQWKLINAGWSNMQQIVNLLLTRVNPLTYFSVQMLTLSIFN